MLGCPFGSPPGFFWARLWQAWFSRHKLLARIWTFYADRDIRALVAVVLLTITFHSVVPIQQGHPGALTQTEIQQTGRRTFIPDRGGVRWI